MNRVQRYPSHALQPYPHCPGDGACTDVLRSRAFGPHWGVERGRTSVRGLHWHDYTALPSVIAAVRLHTDGGGERQDSNLFDKGLASSEGVYSCGNNWKATEQEDDTRATPTGYGSKREG